MVEKPEGIFGMLGHRFVITDKTGQVIGEFSTRGRALKRLSEGLGTAAWQKIESVPGNMGDVQYRKPYWRRIG